MFEFRPGALDEYIYLQVVDGNEYGLPDRFSADDIVVDVGAHIGAFAYAAAMRGAGKVYAIEPDRENFEIAGRNLKPFLDDGRVHLIQAAAWRSDPNDDRLSFQGYPKLGDVINTGGGRVLAEAAGRPVEKIGFDAFLTTTTGFGTKPVRFLKLDCEGSEWPVLFTSKMLRVVSEIAAEIHETRVAPRMAARPPAMAARASFDAYSIDDLVDLLERQGFLVEYRPGPFGSPPFERLGLLRASR